MADLKEAVSQLVDEQLGDNPDNTDVNVIDDDANTDDTNTEDETDNSDEGESAEELAEAKRVYKLLQNPTTAKTLIRELARAEGLLGEEAPNAPTTTKEVAAAKKSIEAILKESLGDKYNFLIPDLSKALDQIFANEREIHQNSVAQLQAQNVQRETTDVLATLARETKGESRKVESRMLELMNKFQIGPGVSIDEYIRGLYAQATSARSTQTATNKLTDKIRRNASDATSRLHSTGSGASERSAPVQTDPNKKMSVKDAVNFALQQQMTQGTKKK
jgi:hypothetical protein